MVIMVVSCVNSAGQPLGCIYWSTLIQKRNSQLNTEHILRSSHVLYFRHKAVIFHVLPNIVIISNCTVLTLKGHLSTAFRYWFIMFKMVLFVYIRKTDFSNHQYCFFWPNCCKWRGKWRDILEITSHVKFFIILLWSRIVILSVNSNSKCEAYFTK